MSYKLMGFSPQLCSPENLLAFLLVSFSAMWVGQKAAFERAECDRGELAVYCRRGQLLDCRMKPNTSPQLQSRSNRNRCEEVWTNWIAGEQKKRLGLCIYVSFLSAEPKDKYSEYYLMESIFSCWTVKWQPYSNVHHISARPRQSIPHYHVQRSFGVQSRPGRGRLFLDRPKFHRARIFLPH